MINLQYTVRSLTEKEIPLLDKLFEYNDLDDMIKENTENIRKGIIDIFALFADNELIGELRVKYQSEDELEAIRGKRAYLFAFRICKDYQNSGLGKYLLKNVINILENKGYCEFTVGVEDNNEKALHIYESFGFKEIIARKTEQYQGDSYEYNLLLKRRITMTEKEKAFSGMLYDPSSLSSELMRCKELCAEYNRLMPSQVDERHKLIKKILRKTGEKFWIEQNFWCDYGSNIEIGENFYANHNLVILDGAKVTFGDNCFIAPNCGFYTAGHPINYEIRNSGLEYALPITVGNNVWIGGNVCVMPGVTIGDNVVIGGGSVVTKNITSGVVAAGNPCKVIRSISDSDKDKYKI